VRPPAQAREQHPAALARKPGAQESEIDALTRQLKDLTLNVAQMVKKRPYSNSYGGGAINTFEPSSSADNGPDILERGEELLQELLSYLTALNECDPEDQEGLCKLAAAASTEANEWVKAYWKAEMTPQPAPALAYYRDPLYPPAPYQRSPTSMAGEAGSSSSSSSGGAYTFEIITDAPESQQPQRTFEAYTYNHHPGYNSYSYPQQPASIFAAEKRPAAAGADPSRRLPSKRQAIDPQVQGQGPRAAPAFGQYPPAPGGPSSSRVPVPPAPARSAPPRPSAGASQNPADRAPAVPNLPADTLAESRGRDMAQKASRSLTVDASRESSLVVPAAKLCAAGFLLNDQHLVDKGREVARKVDGYTQRLLPGVSAGAPPAAAAANFLATTECAPDPVPVIFDFVTSPFPLPPSFKISTCKVVIQVYHPETAEPLSELLAILDTGATQSAVTMGTLSSLGLIETCLDRLAKSWYTNADGRKAQTEGTAKGLNIGIGPVTTKLDMAVTLSPNYSMLLGNDYLMSVGGVLDLKARELRYDINPGMQGRAELLCFMGPPSEQQPKLVDHMGTLIFDEDADSSLPVEKRDSDSEEPESESEIPELNEPSECSDSEWEPDSDCPEEQEDSEDDCESPELNSELEAPFEDYSDLPGLEEPSDDPEEPELDSEPAEDTEEPVVDSNTPASAEEPEISLGAWSKASNAAAASEPAADSAAAASQSFTFDLGADTLTFDCTLEDIIISPRSSAPATAANLLMLSKTSSTEGGTAADLIWNSASSHPADAFIPGVDTGLMGTFEETPALPNNEDSYDFNPAATKWLDDPLMLEDYIEVGMPTFNSGELPSFTEQKKPSSVADIKLGDNLNAAQQAELLSVLKEYEDVFAFTPKNFGCSDVVTFDIKLKEGTTPFAASYHQTPFKLRSYLRAELDEMLEQGLIEPSKSPWASPVVLVPKKEPGTYRLTLDYRRLNSCTVSDAYPLPRLEEILASLGGIKYYASVDCTRGFLQLVCTPEAAELCAFTTPFGLYQPTRMMMGLKNSPPVWQRAMNIGLKEHIGTRVFVYMDDAIIIGRTFEELLDNVAAVLESFRAMNIKLSPSKSIFGVNKLKFLGHIITPEGTTPDPDVIKAVQSFPVPREKVHVQRFLGLTNWLRKFIKDYARIAAPLTRLTGKVPFEFGEQEMAAFEMLKQKLISPPILRHPDLDLPFILRTDACKIGFGAILSQRDPDGSKPEHIIRYGSKKTSAQEAKYSASDLECAAAVHFIKKYHPYLAGGPFTLVTDHQALKYLMTTKDLTGRLARYALYLQEYDFEVEYRKGKEHGDVDALSRMFEPEEEPPTAGMPPLLSTQAELNLALSQLKLDSPELTPKSPSPSAGWEQGLPPTPKASSDPLSLDPAPRPEMPHTRMAVSPRLDTSALLTELSYPVRIAIEGNIGAGKSSSLTLLDDLTSKGWSLYQEPVSLWDKEGALTDFYNKAHLPRNSKERWMAVERLQKTVIKSYLDLDPLPPKVVMERGPWSSLGVFLPAARLHPAMELDIYQEAVADTRLSKILPSALIYIDTPPLECYNRINNRGAAYEKDISLSYLRDLDNLYQGALSRYPGPIIKVDGTLPPLQVAEKVYEAVIKLATSPPLPADQITTYLPDPSVGRTPTFWDDIELTQPVEPFSVENFSFNSTKIEDGCPFSALGNLMPPYKATGLLSPHITGFDGELDALVLYQNGPGALEFSPAFKELHLERYQLEPSTALRVDCFKTLEVALDLGFPAAFSSGSPAFAVIPRKGLPGLKILTDQPSGLQMVYICPERYAQARMGRQQPEEGPYQPIWDAYRAEGAWLSGLTRTYKTAEDFLGEVPIMRPKPPLFTTLTRAGTSEDFEDCIFMGDTCGTPAEEHSTDSGPSVDINLPCSVCHSPDEWETMLLCSKCNRGFHTTCLKMQNIPKGPWECPICIMDDINPGPSPDRFPDDWDEEPPFQMPAAAAEHNRSSSWRPPRGQTPYPSQPSSSKRVGPSAALPSGEENTEDGFNNDIWEDAATIFYIQHKDWLPGHFEDLNTEEETREKKRIKRRASSYSAGETADIILKVPTAGHPLPRLVPAPESRRTLVLSIHESAGHLGITKVLSMLTQHYYFAGMKELVTEVLKSCHACAHAKADFKPDPELHPLEPLPAFQRVSLDTFGPFPVTSRGNVHIVVAIDGFTKWVEAAAIPNKQASTTAAFLEEWFSRYGKPKEVLTDNGPEFRGNFISLLDTYNVKHITSSSYRPTSNGQAERTVQTLLHALQKTAVISPVDWDLKLPSILMGMRYGVQSSTNYSPFFLVYGRLPPALEIQDSAAAGTSAGAPPGAARAAAAAPPSAPNPEELPLPHELNASLQQRSQALNDAAAKAVDNIYKAQEKQKRAYARRRGLPTIPEEPFAPNAGATDRMPVGSLVLMMTPPRGRKKLDAKAEGPFRVVAYNSNQTEATLEDAQGLQWLRSTTQIAPYIPTQGQQQQQQREPLEIGPSEQQPKRQRTL